MKRVVLAGLLGGLAMFVWTSAAHMALPLGEAGIEEIPNDAELVSALHAKLGGAHGMYLYPGMASVSMADYQKKLAAQPSGLLIYHPPGADTLTPGRLVTEFATELLEALFMVWLMARGRIGSYWGRVGLAAVCGILAALATNVSYWNWYGFPASYTAAYMLTVFVGFVAAGLAAARFVRADAI